MTLSEQAKTKLTCDLVYLWVDGNDPKIIEKRNFWREKYGKPINQQAVNDCRFIDNEELKYSLRSVEKYAPWINNIYIITDNQVPGWLNTSNPKIHIIDHTDIMPAEALPTFNSTALETCLHKIKGLCEYFLFANDDMLFANPTNFDFFFNEKNLPVFRVGHALNTSLSKNSIYYSLLLYTYDKINKKFGTNFNEDPDHNITPYRKSVIEECIKTFQKDFDYVTMCKFRENNTILRTAYSAYGCAIGKTTLKSINRNKISLLEKFLYTITNSHKKDSIYFSGHSKNIIKKIKKYKPNLICINDDENTHTNDRLSIKNTLESLFPEKSAFEI